MKSLFSMALAILGCITVAQGKKLAPPAPEKPSQKTIDLMRAASTGDTKGIEAAVAKGADPNIAVAEEGFTALLLASEGGHAEAVRALLDKGADPNKAAKDGGRPLLQAAGKGHAQIVRMLILKGAKVDTKDAGGWTPLMLAAQEGQTEVVQALLDAHADPDVADDDGVTALITAQGNGHGDIVELLEKVVKKKQSNRSPSDLSLSDPNDVPQPGQEIRVKPLGAYADIDTRLMTETMDVLEKGGGAERQKAAAQISAHPENYAPPVFFSLSYTLFEQGKKDDAVFWFFAGQLRGTFDALRCAEHSARDGIQILTMNYGDAIRPYAFRDRGKLLKTIEKVVVWDRNTLHNYDQRWINLHSLESYEASIFSDSTGKPLSVPRQQWDSIAEDTRVQFLKAFRDVAKQKGK